MKNLKFAKICVGFKVYLGFKFVKGFERCLSFSQINPLQIRIN